MLFRTSVKLYVERRSNREGSRIRSKLILGALGLTLTPVLFSILFSVYVLNNKLDKWFSRPARYVEINLHDVDRAFRSESQDRAQAEADWLSVLPQTRDALQTGIADAAYFRHVCEARRMQSVVVLPTRTETLSRCAAANWIPACRCWKRTRT